MDRKKREAIDRHILGDETDYWGINEEDERLILLQNVDDLATVVIEQGKQLVELSLQLHSANERFIKFEKKINELLLNKQDKKVRYDDEVF